MAAAASAGACGDTQSGRTSRLLLKRDDFLFIALARALMIVLLADSLLRAVYLSKNERKLRAPDSRARRKNRCSPWRRCRRASAIRRSRARAPTVENRSRPLCDATRNFATIRRESRSSFCFFSITHRRAPINAHIRAGGGCNNRKCADQ